MLAHTCERHLRNTCERHLIPANDVHSSRTNRHTKAYNHVFQQRSSTERRWASIWHWELPKKKQFSSLYKWIVYSFGIPNNSHLLVLIRSFGYGRTDNINWYGCPRTTQTGVRQIRARAYRMNGNGRSAETLLWHRTVWLLWLPLMLVNRS